MKRQKLTWHCIEIMITKNTLLNYLEEAHGTLVSAAKEAHLVKHPQAEAISKLINALEGIIVELEVEREFERETRL